MIPENISVSSKSVQWETDESLSNCPMHMLGNLPFNIAIPLLIRWLKQVSHRSGPYAFGYRIPITICLQEDVAGRIVSDALMHTRGRLSIIFQNWFDCHVKHIFSGRAFVPATSVNVAIIQMIPLKKPLVDVSFDLLDKVTRAAFHLRNRPLNDTLKYTVMFEMFFECYHLLFPSFVDHYSAKKHVMKIPKNCLTGRN